MHGIKQALWEEYSLRINRVQDYIETNLSEALSLKELSRIANFSSFHFHRIFLLLTGERLFEYIQRVRLEKAAFFLIANPAMEIVQIALACGFSNQASFAKAFKKYYGVNASQFRIQQGVKRQGVTTESNMRKVSSNQFHYNNHIGHRPRASFITDTGMAYQVEVKQVPAMKVIYLRHRGAYKENAELFKGLFNQLFQWAHERGLMSEETKWLTLFHDNLDLTEEDKLRISLCMAVSEEVEAEGEIGSRIIAEGKYAVGRFLLKDDQYQEAWDAMYGHWLPGSGYQPDDRLSFEHYPENLLETSRKVEIYIPVKPLW